MGVEPDEQKSTLAMPVARLMTSTPPEYVRAEDIPTHRHRWPARMLRCAECSAVVHAVYPTPKELSRPQRPHFRRQGKVGGRENHHELDCLYNIEQRIRVLRANSGEAVVRERSKSKSGPARYRLVVPEAFEPVSSSERAGAGVQVVAERLTTVLDTAAKIAALVEDYSARGVDPNIEWYAECRGERIAWLDFLYTPLRTWALRKRLGSPGAQPTHPVAVIFLVHEQKTPRAGGLPIRRRVSAGYRAATYPLLSDAGQLRSENLLVVGEYQLIQEAFTTGSGKCYIGYGMWRCLTHGRRKRPQLTLRMDNTSQVAPLPVDISGTTLSRWRYWRQSQPRPVT